MEERVCSEVSRTICNNDFPFVIAGDHSTAYGTIAGIKKADPKCRLGVIWIDAHADMHSPFTTPSANMHGMPLSMACGIDNLECKVNDPSVDTLEFWKQIKNIGIVGPKVSPEDIVYIGMRDLEKPENYLISKHHIKFIEIEDINRFGPKKIACIALKMLSHCDKIYISFDVDTLDSGISCGTGTPVANGLTVAEAKILNVELTKSLKVCAWEIVEVNPTLDIENRMAKNAFEILEATAKSIVSRDDVDEVVSGAIFPLDSCRESVCRCRCKSKCSKNLARRLITGS